MKRKAQRVSAIILAGGRSSRMGICKAELSWNGTTLIEHQVNKMRSLGIDDIIISGYPKPVEGARFAADKYLLKGPLGGIHAGLLAAENSTCLVVSVDTPLMPAEVFSELIQAHLDGSANITVLSHGNEIEPLMGVYERWLSGIAEQILQSDNTSVRVLFRRAGISRFEFCGDERLLCDCNTPAEYEAACKMTL